jgi:hypothetical protein
MHTQAQNNFAREIHKAISFADDKFQRSRTSEYKHIFGMLRGALLMGLPYEMYSSLYSHVWECKFDSDGVDMEDPEQAELNMED